MSGFISVSGAVLMAGVALNSIAHAQVSSEAAAAAKFIPGLAAEIVEAAKKEGTVTLYAGQMGQGQFDAFKKAVPFVKIDYVQLPAGQLLARFEAEKQAGLNQVDLFMSPEAGFMPMFKRGWCEAYRSVADARFSTAAKPGAGAYRVGAAPFGFMFSPSRTDSALVADLKTWKGAFTSEKLKGKRLGVVNPTPGSATAYALETLYANYDGSSMWGTQRGLVSAVNIYASAAPTSSALIAGELDIAGVVILGPAGDLLASGAPIGWVAPEPLVMAPFAGCIATNPPHPNAAKVLWEFLLSDAGQIAQAPQLISVKSGVDIDSGMPDFIKKQPWYTPLNTSQLLEAPEETRMKISPTALADWQNIFAKK